MNRRRNNIQGIDRLSRVNPVGGDRGCICPDGQRYHKDCCDGSRHAQGIGDIGPYKGYPLQAELQYPL